MSNYVKNTNYTVKDGYTTGDSRKTVKGTELDGEFNDIADAIASKADTASPTFTGTPAAPTASSGTNTTQLATTAFVTSAVSTATGALGTMSTQNKTAVDITGGTIVGITDLAVADGGTGSSTASGARTNLGLGTLATLSTITDSEITSSTITPSKLAQPLTRGTAVASTSGTSITFSSIPSWVKKITVMFSGVSTNGTAQILVQIGAGSITTTGYLGTACINVTGATTNTNSTGFRIEPSDASITVASVRHGTAVLTNITGNTWCFTCAHGHSNTNCSTYGGGSLALSGTLDRVVITTTNGTDTFDAGSINIMYE